MRPGFNSPPFWHDCDEINTALIHLADALCTFERATGPANQPWCSGARQVHSCDCKAESLFNALMFRMNSY